MKKFFISAIAALACLISLDLFAAECTGISFDPALDYYTQDDEETGYTYYYPNSLETLYLEGIPEEYIGLLSLGFYSNSQSQSWTSYASVGTYDLGSGDNSNYSSCHQCVMLDLYDWNNNYAYVSSFYQKEGTLKVTRTDFVANDHYYYEGLLSVKLAEAEIDEDSFESSFVNGGSCYEIESAAWSVFPDEGDTGSDDPTDTGSDEPAECTGISFDPALDYYTKEDEETGGTYYYPNSLETIYLEGIPEEYIGLLSLEFFSNSQSVSWTNYASVGTYDLGSGDNGDYASCHQCVMLNLYDLNNNYAYVGSFYQKEGTLQVTRTDFVANDHYYYEGVLSVKLAEAEIDESNNYASSFVENGGCYEIESAAWSVFPEEDPTDTGSDDPTDTGSDDPADTGYDDPTDTGNDDPTDTGSEEPTDTGSEPTDTGSEPTDTGSEDPTDTGSETTDTGSETTDTGSEDPTDTGSETTDTGSETTDTGSEDPTDTGSETTDTGSETTDTGSETTDTGSEPTDTGSEPSEDEDSSGCTLVTL